MSLAQRMKFLQNVFQMTTVVLVLGIIHYHINGLYLFETPYIYIYIYIYKYLLNPSATRWM